MYSQSDKEKFLETAYLKLEPFSKFLGDKKFLFGDKVTYADLYLTEFLCLVEAIDEGVGLSTKLPNISTLRKTVEELPEIHEFINSERCEKLIFNGNEAHINAS